jgi:hypothetical protein
MESHNKGDGAEEGERERAWRGRYVEEGLHGVEMEGRGEQVWVKSGLLPCSTVPLP